MDRETALRRLPRLLADLEERRGEWRETTRRDATGRYWSRCFREDSVIVDAIETLEALSK